MILHAYDVFGWELEPPDLAFLAAYVNREEPEEEAEGDGYDDMFDGPVYRVTQSTFAGRGHHMMPRGQTHYRPAVAYSAQGVPLSLSSAHWDYLPDASVRRHPTPASRSGSRLAWTVAQDAARPSRARAPVYTYDSYRFSG